MSTNVTRGTTSSVWFLMLLAVLQAPQAHGADGTGTPVAVSSNMVGPIPPGRGFFVTAKSAAFTNTWVGNVRQGPMPLPKATGGSVEENLKADVLAAFPGQRYRRLRTAFNEPWSTNTVEMLGQLLLNPNADLWSTTHPATTPGQLSLNPDTRPQLVTNTIEIGELSSSPHYESWERVADLLAYLSTTKAGTPIAQRSAAIFEQLLVRAWQMQKENSKIGITDWNGTLVAIRKYGNADLLTESFWKVNQQGDVTVRITNDFGGGYSVRMQREGQFCWEVIEAVGDSAALERLKAMRTEPPWYPSKLEGLDQTIAVVQMQVEYPELKRVPDRDMRMSIGRKLQALQGSPTEKIERIDKLAKEIKGSDYARFALTSLSKRLKKENGIPNQGVDRVSGTDSDSVARAPSVLGAEAARSLGQYEIEGVFEQANFGRIPFTVSGEFRVFFRDGAWLIQTIENQLDGKILLKREIGSVNGAEIFEVVTPLQPTNEPAAATNQTAARPNNAGDKRFATGSIASNSVPVGQLDGSVVGHLWLMLASHRYLSGLTTNLLTPVYDVSASAPANPNLRRKAVWELIAGPGSLPAKVTYFDDYGIIEAVYRATGVANVNGVARRGDLFVVTTLLQRRPNPVGVTCRRPSKLQHRWTVGTGQVRSVLEGSRLA